MSELASLLLSKGETPALLGLLIGLLPRHHLIVTPVYELKISV